MQNVIFYFFSFFIEAIVLWQYTSSLFVPSKKISLRFTILCMFYLILFAVSILGINWLNMILYLLANFIFMATLFHLKWYLALFHSSVLSAVMGMCELSVYSIIGHFIPHFWVNSEHFHNKVIFTVFAKTRSLCSPPCFYSHHLCFCYGYLCKYQRCLCTFSKSYMDGYIECCFFTGNQPARLWNQPT